MNFFFLAHNIGYFGFNFFKKQNCDQKIVFFFFFVLSIK